MRLTFLCEYRFDFRRFEVGVGEVRVRAAYGARLVLVEWAVVCFGRRTGATRRRRLPPARSWWMSSGGERFVEKRNLRDHNVRARVHATTGEHGASSSSHAPSLTCPS